MPHASNLVERNVVPLVANQWLENFDGRSKARRNELRPEAEHVEPAVDYEGAVRACEQRDLIDPLLYALPKFSFWK